MKVALATERDQVVLQDTYFALEQLSEGVMPSPVDAEEEPFDIEDGEQCKQALKALLDIADTVALLRCASNLIALLDPKNKIIDPNAITLEVHPDRLTPDEKAMTHASH